MLIPQEAYDALVDAGATVSAEVRADGRVEVLVGIPGEGSRERTLALEVRRYSRPVTPREVTTAVERRGGAFEPPAGERRRGLLLVTPGASAETARRAGDLGVSLIVFDRRTKDGVRGHLALGPGDVVPLGRAATPPPPAGRRPGVPARGELQIVKTLLLLGGRTQAEIARWASVSQPRVSQVLKRLAERGLVSSSVVEPHARVAGGPAPPPRAWTVVDWDRLLRHWLSRYPGPGGVTTHWYGLEAPARQAHAVLEVLGRATSAHRVLVSGDVAADLIAPWARPAHAMLYTDVGADLSPAGLTPSPAADATLALTVPEETGLWRFADGWWQAVGQDPAPDGLPLADPLQVLHDAGRSPSVDADQAVETLKSRIRTLRGLAAANLDAEVHG